MFKKFLISFFLIFSFYNHSFAAVKNGDLAPQINMTAASGNQIKLNDYLGKIIVLEWKNHDCPFVRKHYDTGNMQMLQKYVTENNGIWLSIISSAPNKQGNVSDNEALSIANSQGSFANEIILDPTGEIGYEFGAKTTPHIFIISKEGKVAYQGAIDDNPSPMRSAVKTARNYVKENFLLLKDNQPLLISQTSAYGCSIKY